eukprot:s921_g5.t1
MHVLTMMMARLDFTDGVDEFGNHRFVFAGGVPQFRSEMHAEFPELAPGKGGFEEAELARLFLGRLKKQANRRKVTEEDIERAPMGPKGETSRVWSGNFWKRSKPPMERLVA